MEAIDITIPAGEAIPTKGIVYYRLDEQLWELLRKCEVDHKIIGFEWEGSHNFGIIIADK